MTHALTAKPAQPIVGEMLIRGVLLAFGCTAAQAALLLGLGWIGLGMVATTVAPLLLAFAHGFFIVTLTDWGIRHAARDEDQRMFATMPVTLAGTLIVGLALLGIGFVSIAGIGNSASPPLGLMGWTLLIATALPARISATVRGEPIAFKPLTRRLLALLPACAPIWALGYLFDRAPGGMMEGGMVVLPFFVLYLFAATLIAAILPATAVSPALD